MTPERSLVPVSEENELPQEFEVTSEYLPNFLIGERYFPFKKWSFASSLDLSHISHHFQKLYEQKQEVYVFPQEVRDKTRDVFANDPEMLSHYERKDHGERSLNLFYNLETDTMEYTDFIHGEYTEVENQILTYISDIQLPYLELHTHPDNHLPSPIDYGNMLITSSIPGRALVRGIAVACPDIQILALTTPSTPLESYQESMKRIQYPTEVMGEELSAIEERRVQRILTLQDASMNRIYKTIEQEEKIIQNEVERREFDGAITQNEGQELRERIGELRNDYLTWSRERVDALMTWSNIRHMNTFQKRANTQLLDFARSINVELFTSTDMRHFEKWTA